MTSTPEQLASNRGSGPRRFGLAWPNVVIGAAWGGIALVGLLALRADLYKRNEKAVILEAERVAEAVTAPETTPAPKTAKSILQDLKTQWDRERREERDALIRILEREFINHVDWQNFTAYTEEAIKKYKITSKDEEVFTKVNEALFVRNATTAAFLKFIQDKLANEEPLTETDCKKLDALVKHIEFIRDLPGMRFGMNWLAQKEILGSDASAEKVEAHMKRFDEFMEYARFAAKASRAFVENAKLQQLPAQN